jgi:ribitol 2-dehydrogenase
VLSVERPQIGLEQQGASMAQNLTGKVMVVTGASSGIGRAAARRFAAEGLKLALVARSAERLRELAGDLGGETLVMPLDLTQPEDVETMVKTTRDRFGQIDILFANAGSYVSGDVVKGDPNEWDRLIALNVSSVFRTVHAVLPQMIERRSGDIVVTSSISGHQAIHWEPVYSATKHAVQSFVHGVRRQIAPHNVRIGSLAPGMVLNELWGLTDPEEIRRRVAAHSGLMNEDVIEALHFMLTRPPHVAVRDLVILPQGQDL